MLWYNIHNLLHALIVDEGQNIVVSYNELWKLLVDKKMSKIAPNTMARLRRDEGVTLGVLGKICKTLDVDYGDIMEYVKD